MSKLETDDLQDVIKFIQGLHPLNVLCRWRSQSIRSDLPEAWSTLVPRYDIIKDTRGFVVKVWYACVLRGKEFK